ncbi:hypothetical protein CU097_001626 [Rhizopus azygosporus]|uniref:DUF2421 domain-containing protein n=1 Tax=Rhizopus azygosporus TaxID=86630 RepID=A0A367JQT1_RHIAZ|nr:hypothetical protein CU097_001626 [Rhizopus azygosporus]
MYISWSAMYLANLARDPTIHLPVQPNSSAILAIFLLISVFAITYLRVKSQQAFLASIFGSIILVFSITQASVTPGFQPVIVYTFLKPIAMSTAIALAVDLLIWPDDSMTKFMLMLTKSLREYNGFFEEHAHNFLTLATSASTTTLPTLHARLQGTILALIDSKREVQREIMWSRLSQQDASTLTRIIKQMRTPLYGIGLSLLSKSDLLNKGELGSNGDEEKDMFVQTLADMRKLSQELTDTCVEALSECSARLIKFGDQPRTLKSTLLWPFPRIFLWNRSELKVPSNDSGLKERLDRLVDRYELEMKHGTLSFINSKTDVQNHFNSLFQIIYLFQFNLISHARNLQELLAFVQNLESTRTRKQLWFPRIGLRKWLSKTQRVDATMGGLTVNNMTSQNDMTLSRTMTAPNELERQEDLGLLGQKNKAGKVTYPRDPDVNPPETAFEKFFYSLYQVILWAQTVETGFAIKTASGFVLLSLPAFLPQSASWFFAWRGQWATVTLMMWMSPLAGMFLFGTVLRVIGTVAGGVLGIIVWEITRGNPYGLAVLMFILMMPLYYLFFTNKMLSPLVIMIQITCILVICYEYQYVTSGVAVYDSAEVVAGKRMLLVSIGVAAAAILSILPKPVTGRVELRKRISLTLHDISKLYGILVGDIISNYDNRIEQTPRLNKSLRKLFLDIRRQVADARSHLQLSKLEPPLRGKFPYETYAVLVEKVDNMADLLIGMAYAVKSIDRSWQRNLVSAMRDERTEYMAFIMGLMKLLSATMASKIALPPFIVSPNDIRDRFGKRLASEIVQCPGRLDNATFPNYCAFTMNAIYFVNELSVVLDCIKQLVGVEDPEQWIVLHS